MPRLETRPVGPRAKIDPSDERLRCGPTLDDVLMLVLATATVLGVLVLIGLSTVSAASRLEAVIGRLAS